MRAAYADLDPPIRLVRPARWRWCEDGLRRGYKVARYAEIWNERSQAWDRKQAWCGAVLAGLDAGDRLPVIVASACDAAREVDPLALETRVRQYLMELYRRGYVDIPLPALPTEFAGRYRVERELGRGGCAVVLLCLDRAREDAPVAVKRAWDFLEPIVHAEEMLRREARILGALDHPRIVAFREEFEQEGRYHLVRDYIDGPDLVQAYHLHGITDRDARIETVAQVLELVAHMHSRGLLLLDMRPSNFLRRDGLTFLLDAGGAQPCDGPPTLLVGRPGSVGFTSPEVLEHRPADARADVFAVGRLYSYLLTGRVPHHPWREKEIAAHLRHWKRPEDEVALVTRLAADDPASRPSSAIEARRIVLGMR